MTASPMSEPRALPRVMGLRDVMWFNITAIVGLRWLTTAASQFGLASLGLWLLAIVIFFLPSAAAVRELVDVDPGAGGLYRWVTRAFGPLHGFLAGWGYWVNNLFYFPSLLVATAAILAYAGGARFVHLGDNTIFIGAVSLAGLWLATGLNVVGLRVGKWLSNIGAFWGTWLPGMIFIVLAAVALVRQGSATPVTARALVPSQFDFPSINLFATMLFAFGGLELAPTLGGEIVDPAATLRRGVVLSGFVIVGLYVLGTGAMLVALPHETVSITNGMPQAAAALVERLGAPALAPVAAGIAILLAIGNIGGVGTWAAGSARLPYVAGVDRVLPPAFGAVHPRWQTPYVALLVQAGLATIFIVAGLAGSSVKNAYLVLTQATIILFFIPFLYMFAAYLRLRRRRTWRGLLTGVSGFLSVLFGIVLSFVPPSDESPVMFEIKLVGGVAALMGIGLVLGLRGVRGRTASPGGGP